MCLYNNVGIVHKTNQIIGSVTINHTSLEQYNFMYKCIHR